MRSGASVMSSDPAKKFDVVFTIDMKELLTKLGAKPDQIQRIMATAEANRKKPPVPSMAFGGGMPGLPGMAAMGGMGGACSSLPSLGADYSWHACQQQECCLHAHLLPCPATIAASQGP
mgnify:CR=1 FL=1